MPETSLPADTVAAPALDAPVATETAGASQARPRTRRTDPKKIQKITVAQTVTARQAAQAAAVQDILSRPENSRKTKAESLRAILQGAAPDDAKAIRRLLRHEAQVKRSQAKISQYLPVLGQGHHNKI